MNFLCVTVLILVCGIVWIETVNATDECGGAQVDCGIKNGRRLCIAINWKCDGEPDCPDGRDEDNCEGSVCTSNQFRCLNAEDTRPCIPVLWQCDGESDCEDGSDERDCQVTSQVSNETTDVGYGLTTSEPKSSETTPRLSNTTSTVGTSERSTSDYTANMTTGILPTSSKEHPTTIEHTSPIISASPVTETTQNVTIGKPVTTPTEDKSTMPDSVISVIETTEVGSTISDITTSSVDKTSLITDSKVTDTTDTTFMPSSRESASTTSYHTSTLLTSTIPACHEAEFQCGDGQCLPVAFRCDGERNCHDGSDEHNCGSYVCEKNGFKCKSGPCIPGRWKCDTVEDCIDGSDESYCNGHLGTIQPLVPRPTTRSTARVTNAFQTTANQDMSTQTSIVTTGFVSTTLSQDTSVCEHGGFKCNSGPCIPGYWKCDTVEDCMDGSDESDCNGHLGTIQPLIPTTKAPVTTTTSTSPTTSAILTTQQEMSTENPSNVTEPDILTETNTTKATQILETTTMATSSNTDMTCKEDEFSCGDDQCIPVVFHCNGVPDCQDRSDEQKCNEYVCKGDQFRCRSGTCIPGYWECDTVEDCMDGSDESDCNGHLGTIQHLIPTTKAPPVTTTTTTSPTTTTTETTTQRQISTESTSNTTDTSQVPLFTSGVMVTTNSQTITMPNSTSQGVVGVTTSSSLDIDSAQKSHLDNGGDCSDMLGQGPCAFVKSECHDSTVSKNCRKTCDQCVASRRTLENDSSFLAKNPALQKPPFPARDHCIDALPTEECVLISEQCISTLVSIHCRKTCNSCYLGTPSTGLQIDSVYHQQNIHHGQGDTHSPVPNSTQS